MNKKYTPFHHISKELPYTSYPTLYFPSFFYKIKNRIDRNHTMVLVGLQLHIMKRSQEDHLIQLIHIFNKESPRIKINIIPPNLIYGEFRIDVMDDLDRGQDVIQMESKLFSLLQTVIQYFSSFIQKYLKESSLLSQQFNSETFIRNFKESVIQKAKQKEKYIFYRSKQTNS